MKDNRRRLLVTVLFCAIQQARGIQSPLLAEKIYLCKDLGVIPSLLIIAPPLLAGRHQFTQETGLYVFSE